MLFHFPPETHAIAMRDYERPYDDPLSVEAGAPVQVEPGRETDLIGWVWCRAADGRKGWVPESWLDGGTLVRAFNAIELTVRAGDRLQPIFSESGFVWCEAEDGRLGWVPDAVLALA